jgi:hypothetical protein
MQSVISIHFHAVARIPNFESEKQKTLAKNSLDPHENAHRSVPYAAALPCHARVPSCKSGAESTPTSHGFRKTRSIRVLKNPLPASNSHPKVKVT